ncbi:hypothetical protein [Sphaerisporangium aureirubrum]|uniref:Uncharacterized protein n=1 Tax=Sphaerisporangium aureirubrum TaxID=1544736 RepID=A0ABW1NLD0_9ACTN
MKQNVGVHHHWHPGPLGELLQLLRLLLGGMEHSKLRFGVSTGRVGLLRRSAVTAEQIPVGRRRQRSLAKSGLANDRVSRGSTSSTAVK